MSFASTAMSYIYVPVVALTLRHESKTSARFLQEQADFNALIAEIRNAETPTFTYNYVYPTI